MAKEQIEADYTLEYVNGNSTAEEFMAKMDEEREGYWWPKRKLLAGNGWYGYNRWYWISRPWRLLKLPAYWRSSVRKFWQRGRRGFSTSDTWGLDSYILSWLPEAIEELRDGNHGWPCTENDPEADTFEHWQETLTSLAEQFRVIRQKAHDLEDCDAEFDAAWTQLGKWWFCLWN